MLPQRVPLESMQTTWAQQLNPLISNPLTQGQLVSAELINGITIVNHKLGRKLIGWLIVGIDGAAQVYDNQASNQTPQLTLSLTSDAAVSCNLWVF